MRPPIRLAASLLLVAGPTSVLLGCSSRSGWEYSGEEVQDRRSLTVLTEEQIAAYPTNWSIEQVIVQGLPGVVLTSGSSGGAAVRGADGSTTFVGGSPSEYISVRGVGGAAALVIVDGVPRPEDSPAIGVNIADVGRIEVLRDAASTALYGFRGGAGVILITTKQGSRSSD